MSDEKQIQINTIDDFLRWVDTGRQLAVETLGAVGVSESEAQKWLEIGGVFAGSMISAPELQPVYVTLEIEAAFKMLWVVERIKTRVTGQEKAELFDLVLDGVRMNDFRNQIYQARWRKMDQRADQSRKAKVRRTPTAALADELRHSHDWTSSLPRRIGATETIGKLRVTLQSDGLFLIEDMQTSKSTAIKEDSIRSAINKKRT